MKALTILAAVLASVGVLCLVFGADTDLAVVLVGKWEGELKRGVAPGKLRQDRDIAEADPSRTLLITKVRQQDGKWIIEDARFGPTGRLLNRVQITVGGTPEAPELEFQTNNGLPVKLKLTREKLLQGTMTARGGRVPLELRRTE